MKFNKNKIIKLVFCIVICFSAGLVGSFFTKAGIDNWYVFLNKPLFSPPNWVFAPVWTILFVLMGVSLFLIWEHNWTSEILLKRQGLKAWNKWSTELCCGKWQKHNMIFIFSTQLLLNILWSVIFFGLHSIGVAFFEILMLWSAIIYTMINFYNVSKAAFYLLVPYFIWVSFAAYLNLGFWLANL